MKVTTSILFTESINGRQNDVSPEYFTSGVLNLQQGESLKHTFEGWTTYFIISRVERILQFDPTLGGSLRDRTIVHLRRVP